MSARKASAIAVAAHTALVGLCVSCVIAQGGESVMIWALFAFLDWPIFFALPVEDVFRDFVGVRMTYAVVYPIVLGLAGGLQWGVVVFFVTKLVNRMCSPYVSNIVADASRRSNVPKMYDDRR